MGISVYDIAVSNSVVPEQIQTLSNNLDATITKMNSSELQNAFVLSANELIKKANSRFLHVLRSKKPTIKLIRTAGETFKQPETTIEQVVDSYKKRTC
jgi:hypothetical protein